MSKFSKFKNSRWIQGHFRPKHIEKYVGDPNKITFRSSWERRLMCFLDNTPSVLNWQSECTIIPYISPIDGQPHRYYIDFGAKIKTKDGIKKFLIEVKPYTQTQKPIVSPRKKQKTILEEEKTYLVNQAKWKSARQYAKKIGAEFLVITEKELGID